MCGLAGFLVNNPLPTEESARIALAMSDRLAHRGPDGDGVWVGDSVALSHRRLAILDLTEAGQQPMLSDSGRYVMVFNGEIYNHLDIRAELAQQHAAPGWRGHSDTETLLAAIAHWGVEKTARRANGMFALAVWDRQTKVLSLARDRFGEKPLYYGWVGNAFVFGSELKAIRAFPGFANQVCREALAQYLRFTYVPAPRSIYQGIFKLEPGCILSLSGPAPAVAPVGPLRPGQSDGGLSITRYWSLAEAVEAGSGDPIVSEADGVDLLADTLKQAVKRQMISDVPLGAFLSGGVDSSAIVAMMQKQSIDKIRTFTVGFEEAGFDESPHARAVAAHLGTDHTEIRISSAQSQDVIPRLPELYDEPFADSSQIPTHLVCMVARTEVTVALSGDAGDEVFGGYNRYFWGPRVWSKVDWMPFPARRVVGAVISGIPMSTWDWLGKTIRVGKGSADVTRLGDKAHKMGQRLSKVNTLDDLYRSLVSEWSDPVALLQTGDIDLIEPPSRLDDRLPRLGTEDAAARMMFRDSETYLPDDILCKVDRAAMAASLETRVPLLDPDVVALAWRLPMSMKIKGNVGKWALREVLYRHVPLDLIERPKAGFAIPVGTWLRGPLRPWAEALLDPSRLSAEGYFEPGPIRVVWDDHLSGRRDWTPKLWTILMFQAWLEAQQ